MTSPQKLFSIPDGAQNFSTLAQNEHWNTQTSSWGDAAIKDKNFAAYEEIVLRILNSPRPQIFNPLTPDSWPYSLKERQVSRIGFPKQVAERTASIEADQKAADSSRSSQNKYREWGIQCLMGWIS